MWEVSSPCVLLEAILSEWMRCEFVVRCDGVTAERIHERCDLSSSIAGLLLQIKLPP